MGVRYNDLRYLEGLGDESLGNSLVAFDVKI